MAQVIVRIIELLISIGLLAAGVIMVAAVLFAIVHGLHTAGRHH
jgi:hypothetical protein